MDNENHPLNQGEFLRQQCVEQQSNQRHCNDQQSDMPRLVRISIGVIDGDDPDHHVCNGIATSGNPSVPSKHADPAGDVAQYALATGRRKFGYPVILAAGCWSPISPLAVHLGMNESHGKGIHRCHFSHRENDEAESDESPQIGVYHASLAAIYQAIGCTTISISILPIPRFRAGVGETYKRTASQVHINTAVNPRTDRNRKLRYL